MIDIPSLIERLGAWSRDQEGTAIAEDLTEAAAELSRLTVSPLPGEIAEIIADLKEQRPFSPFSKEATDRAAAALQRLAEEVERLTRALSEAEEAAERMALQIQNDEAIAAGYGPDEVRRP